METELNPRRSFIIQVVTVVHTCHSHNVAACHKRLDAARRLFSANCKFDALFDTFVRDSLDEIASKLAQLRYVDSSDEAEETRIKSDCLVTVRRLHDIVKRIKLRTDHQQSADSTFVDDEDLPTDNLKLVRHAF